MSFTIPIVSHDPNDVLDYEVNWRASTNPVLAESESISTSTWAIDGMRVGDDGVVSTTDGQCTIMSGGSRDPSVTGDVSKCWVQGGTPGMQYLLRNRMVTNATPSRTFDRSRWLAIDPH